MTTWRILKLENGEEGQTLHDVWREVGTHESERDWSLGIDVALSAEEVMARDG